MNDNAHSSLQSAEQTGDRYQAQKAMLLMLESVFAPGSTLTQACRGSVIISLDLEYSMSPNVIDQVGIAVLDTAELSRLTTDDQALVAIRSRLLLLRRQHLPRNTCTRQYLFGIPEPAVDQSLKDLLMPILAPSDGAGRPRNVVLLGHGIDSDILAIQRCCDFDIRSVPSIQAIVDTSWMPALLFGLRHGQMSLKKTCQMLGIKARQLHNAGNDALYTLKALLVLFQHYKRDKLMHEVNDNASSVTEGPQVL